MENLDIARVLDELGDLLELQGANPFRIRAYRNATRTVEGLTRSLSSMVEAGEDLTELPAIGKDMAAHIEELLSTGSLGRLDEVAREIPRTLVELMRLDGVGPKKARRLFEELDVETVDDLERAARAGTVESLGGFGAKSVEKILRAIDDHRSRQGRFLIDEAEKLVAGVLSHMASAPGVERIEVAGSLRRRRETIGDVDLLAVCEGDGTSVVSHFVSFPGAERVAAAGGTKGNIVLRSGLSIDLRVVPAESFGAAWQYFTGSKEHNVAVRAHAVKQGLKVNEWGVFRVSGDGDPSGGEGERVAGATEQEVYRALGMRWMPPELRENRGEVALALKDDLPRVVSVEDIRGDLQMHSTWSDGKASVEEMARACLDRGYEYFALTDHSPAMAMVRGLTPEKAREQWKEIDRVQERVPGIRILKSCEVDILRDGSLDLPDDVLEGLDVVVVSVHTLMDMDRSTMTERVIRALRHPRVDILAHPTGRILNRRNPFEMDVEAVLEAALELDVAVELNANPHRLDLNDLHVHRARELGVKVVISTDAHSPEGLGNMRFGVDQARRGWLRPDDVVNTWPWPRFSKWLGRRG
ncbi:MAG: DNA polymerase/3'-5' exonuclease PolX [Gemmatimonadota bacterium]|nr:DNA polymerase/3'-5' exonuclease PolX [Gemmatimonadota bacterium]MDH5759590.1 DNA polymerase/3'-5' exonuclease PolX [Gemmatimonadota bacterium]